MKFSNFVEMKRLTDTLGYVSKFAEVDVTEGWLFKKTSRRQIGTMSGSGNWRFMDTGDLTPGYEVEHLSIADEMKRKFNSK